jgi:formylglycine-generating enzyme required for sulfatase activity
MRTTLRRLSFVASGTSIVLLTFLGSAIATLLPASAQNDKSESIEVEIPGLPEGARPLRLILIPAGTFQMGSPGTERGRYYDYEGPVHQVTIGYDYYIGETEVTQAQWQAVMHKSPSAGYGVGNDYPVYAFGWNDSQSFITALNALTGMSSFRLPSEAEWEYACRAGTTTRFSFGNSLSCNDECENCVADTLPGDRSDYMWWCGTRPQGTRPVHGALPNGLGLFDTHGNVWEWCQDYWHYNYNGAPSDGSAWMSLAGSDGSHVIRGGSCMASASNCRSAMRARGDPSYWGSLMGLRVVLPGEPSSVNNWELFE